LALPTTAPVAVSVDRLKKVHTRKPAMNSTGKLSTPGKRTVNTRVNTIR
jgi:hypothetical protein